MDANRPETYSSQKETDTWGLVDAIKGTQRACCNVHEEKLTYMRSFKCKKLRTGDERATERLVYTRLFDTKARDRSANGVDGLLAALDDKRLEVSLHDSKGRSASHV
jgi:hypothetical protein